MDFWDNEPGDSKPRRRRKSLKTFSLTPATFRGIWHWRVSAISLSGPMATPLPAPAPPATCPLALTGGCPSPTGPGPHCARAPPRDAKAGLPQDSLFSHSFIEPFTYPFTHSFGKYFFYPCYAPGPVLGIWGANKRKAWSNISGKFLLSP